MIFKSLPDAGSLKKDELGKNDEATARLFVPVKSRGHSTIRKRVCGMLFQQSPMQLVLARFDLGRPAYAVAEKDQIIWSHLTCPGAAKHAGDLHNGLLVEAKTVGLTTCCHHVNGQPVGHSAGLGLVRTADSRGRRRRLVGSRPDQFRRTLGTFALLLC
ncbi:unnamed protein product, partial [Protopolystoma xenopodis]